jgi:putative transposase
MSYDALRRGRYSQPHQVYCLTIVVHHRRPIFTDFTVARLLVRELRRLHTDGVVRSLAWVVMPDHLHWMIQLNECWALSRVLKTLKARSAIAINKHMRQRGSLWQRAYYDRAVRKKEDVRLLARYIVANPLRAGLVQNIGSYSHWDCIWMSDRDDRLLVE